MPSTHSDNHHLGISAGLAINKDITIPSSVSRIPFILKLMGPSLSLGFPQLCTSLQSLSHLASPKRLGFCQRVIPKQSIMEDYSGHLLPPGRSGAGEQLLHEQTFSPAPKPIQEVTFAWIVSVIQFTMASYRQQCWQSWAWGGERLSMSRAGISWVGVIVWKTHLSCIFWKRFQYVIYQGSSGLCNRAVLDSH